jgi:hypothetical protein
MEISGKFVGQGSLPSGKFPVSASFCIWQPEQIGPEFQSGGDRALFIVFGMRAISTLSFAAVYWCGSFDAARRCGNVNPCAIESISIVGQ